jgi:hypothetical protein
MKANEKPVKGTKGFILYSPFRTVPFFRVYNEDKTFIDYDINCEELEVELISDWNSFYSFSDGSNTLDWSSRALGRPNENS